MNKLPKERVMLVNSHAQGQKKKKRECSNKKVSAESLRFVCDMFYATLIAFPRSSLFLEEMGFLVE